jgi:hypothetical protein
VKILLAPIAVALILFIIVSGLAAAHFIRTHGWFHVLRRALTGHHLDGNHRSNRSWLYPGTRAASDSARVHVTWLSRRPRWERAAVTWALILGVPYTLYGLYAEPTLTINLLLASVAAGALFMSLRLARRVAHRGHRRHVIQPLAQVLSGHLGITPEVVSQNLRISPKLEALTSGQRAAMLKNIPDHWHGTEADQTWVEEMMSARLPAALDFHWKLARHPMKMEALIASSPPPQVTLAGSLDHIAELGFGQYFLGTGADDITYDWDCTEEDPEGAVGSRTRGGKTNLLSAVVAQGLARGEQFAAVDPKRRSLIHFQGVPGFSLANDPRKPEQMVALILAFHQDMMRALDDGNEDEHKTLILEEMNALWALLSDWWQMTKQPGQRVMDNPAWRAVKDILHMGAQYNRRVMVSGQDLKDQVLFGSRSQFGTVLMNRYSAKQWAYTMQSTPVPPTPAKRGRFWLKQGGEPVLIQVVCADPRKGHGHQNEDAWRQYALAGRAPLAGTPRTWPHPWEWRPDRAYLEIEPAPVQRSLPPVLVGYAQAAQYLGMTPAAFRKARQRYPIPGEFTETVIGRKDTRPKPCWHKDTLDLWRSGTKMRDNDTGQREDADAH